jgi:hypothetical protein
MPYIKISDPNIIDLAAWHQVINVVNQHSDSISAITNNFGIQGSGTTDWNGEAEIYEEFNTGSQKLLYGKFRIDAQGTNKDSSMNGDLMFYKTIDFDNDETGSTSFSAKPVITVTPALLREDVSTMVNNNAGLVCTVIGITQKSFTVRIIKSREIDTPTVINANTKPTGFFNINWIAIGPK